MLSTLAIAFFLSLLFWREQAQRTPRRALAYPVKKSLPLYDKELKKGPQNWGI